MEQLTTFTHEMGEIRMLEIQGEPWFVGNDVAKILGYSNSSKAVITHVDSEDKRTEVIPTSQNGNTVGKVNLINESGLYSLILSSKLPTAKIFKKWVTSEVLPSIRKHGFYAKKELVNDPDFLIALGKMGEQMKQEQAEKEALQQEVQLLSEALTEYAPQISYLEKILSSDCTLTTTQIAADYGISARKLNDILHQERVQYKVNGQWILYQEHKNQNLTHSETMLVNNGLRSVVHTKWTQYGRLLIHNILIARGFEPL
ncbi:MAG: BRO family protein [Eubacteriales bacterium]